MRGGTMDGSDIDRSVAYRIEHHTEQGTTVVRHLVEIDQRAVSSMISRVFQEVLAGFHARGAPGRLVMVEEETGQVVESALIAPTTGAEP